MSLQDEHLKQALKHAPDKDLAPSDAARAAVLAYANQALNVNQVTWRTRISHWVREWFGSNWYSTGLGSAVATVLIVLVVWHQQPEDTTWKAANPTEETAISASDSVAEITPQAASAEKKSELVATASAPAPASANISPKVSANTEQFSLKASDLADATPPAEIKAEQPVAAAPAPRVIEDYAALASEKGELAKSDNVARKSVVRTEALGKALPKAIDLNDEHILTHIKNEGGKVAANQDIQAGHLRLIKVEALTKDSVTLGCPEMPSKLMTLDALTGYQVETIGACDDLAWLQSEAEAYNQTMRDWQSSHLK